VGDTTLWGFALRSVSSVRWLAKIPTNDCPRHKPSGSITSTTSSRVITALRPLAAVVPTTAAAKNTAISIGKVIQVHSWRPISLRKKKSRGPMQNR